MSPTAANGSGYVINGKFVQPRGAYRVFNYFDNPSTKLLVGPGQDGGDLGINRGPNNDVRIVVFHSTKGETCKLVKPGLGPPSDDGDRVARFWSFQDHRNGEKNHQGGAQIAIDRDGDVHCLADLGRVAAYHASNREVNLNSIGIEIYQEGEKDNFALYDGQLDVAVYVADDLTRIFGIQRQVPDAYHGSPIARLHRGGKDFVGVCGHRDVTSNRGKGDPGPEIMEKLIRAGYEAYDFKHDEDKNIWAARQQQLGGRVDGVPYADTVAALIRAGHRFGQWVSRPGDY